eukprot:5515880-Pyramimonas_sp.AAC.1
MDDSKMGGNASSEWLREVRAKGAGKGSSASSGLAAAPDSAVQAPHLATAQAPNAASGLALAPNAAVQAPQPATMTPEETFRQILKGQSEVTAT